MMTGVATGAARLAMLAVFSGLSMNVILQFGFGLKGIAFEKTIRKKELLAGSGVFFSTVMLLWLIFSFARSVLFLGFLEYVFLFPFSFLVFSVLDYLMQRLIMRRFITQKTAGRNETTFLSGVLAAGAPLGGATAGAALFFTLHVASGLLEAAVLAMGFTLGIAFAIVAVGEIRRRAGMEAVPHWLRGGPLALIAMGLLALIFSSGAIMFFEVLGAY